MPNKYDKDQSKIKMRFIEGDAKPLRKFFSFWNEANINKDKEESRLDLDLTKDIDKFTPVVLGCPAEDIHRHVMSNSISLTEAITIHHAKDNDLQLSRGIHSEELADYYKLPRDLMAEELGLIEAREMLKDNTIYLNTENESIAETIQKRINTDNIILITPDLISRLFDIEEAKLDILSILENEILPNILNVSMMTMSALDKIYMEYIRLKNKCYFMERHNEYIDRIQLTLEFFTTTLASLKANTYILKDDENLAKDTDKRNEQISYYTIANDGLINNIKNYCIFSKIEKDLMSTYITSTMPYSIGSISYGQYKNNQEQEMRNAIEAIDANMFKEREIPKGHQRYEESKNQMMRRQFRGGNKKRRR